MTNKLIMESDEIQTELDNEEKKLKSWKDKRAEALGFRPQNEIFHNFHLPLSSIDIDKESAELFRYIKNQLGLAVAYREVYPSSGIYLTKLMSYIKLYGLKFSKDDHVQIIKLLLKIAFIPNLDPTKLNKCCIILSELLRRSHLLSPDDLQIEWRPLLSLAKIYIDKRGSKGELIRFYSKTDEEIKSSNFNNLIKKMLSENYGFDLDFTRREKTLEQNIHFVIQLCAPYFPLAANKEILDELLPQLQPLDNGKSTSEFELLSIFLSPYSYNLWFDHFMDLWNIYHYPIWNLDIMNLIASTAGNTIGLIDWTPHIPVMFTRILRSLELPVSYKQIKSSKNQSLCADASATWIVAVLGPKFDAMRYLRNLFSTIESYLNIANSGKWVRHISDLLVQLVKYFQERLISERYKKHPWKPEIPNDYKLRDQDVTEFVEIFKPIAMIAMYSRMNSIEIGKIFKGLAELRPEIILPGIIERVCTTAEIINEPHKFTAALSSLSSVSSVIVSGRRGTEVARTQLIPIMFSVLPGIDSNDFKKTSITLQFLITASILLPIVDCSKAFLHHELSEEESLICEQTAQFEDFVLQFLDRIFFLIESSSVETTRMEHSSMENNVKSKLESIAEALVQNAGHSILGQCSQEILDLATNKLVNYVKGSRALEPRVAGAAMSSLCRVFARVNGKDTYRALIPHLTDYIQTHFSENDDMMEMEKQRDDFLYYLQLLTTLIRGHPHQVTPYIDTLVPIIDKLLKCKCKTTARAGATMISHLMIIFSTMQTNDIKTVPYAFEKPLSEFLPIRHWGWKMNREEKFVWFVPGEEERAMCEKLIHHYLLPILDRFQQYIDGTAIISRDQMQIDLIVVSAILKCNNFLSNWNDEKPLHLVDTITDIQAFNLTLPSNGLEVKMPNGMNTRKCLIEILDKLQTKILTDNEDDIKSLKQLLLIWDKVHLRMHSNPSHEVQLKNYQASRQFQEYKLCRKRKDIRAVVATRVIIQQDLRDEMSLPLFTETHRRIMLNLITLSTSRYSAIRSTAQSNLFKMFNTYSFAYRSVTDEIVKHLALDPNENHEAFKGALYLIGTNRRHRLMLKPDWETISKLWMAFFKTQLSEKHSIVRLMESITEGIHTEFQTIATEVQVSDEIVELGVKMVIDKNILPADYLKAGATSLQKRNERNKNIYYALINEILEYSGRSSLHWRYHLLCSTLVNDLMHPVSKYQPNVTKMFVKNLIHDSIEERAFALRICDTILKQQKREHKKIEIDPFKMTGTERPKTNELLKPGIREDNKFMWYEIDNLPRNQAQWDEPRYIYKTNGFFGWTSKVEVYAPSNQQPKLDRSYEELNEHEKVFYDFFSDSKSVDKLIEYWSMEEKKGKEKFQRSRFWFFKQIFDTFGDTFLDSLLEHLKALILNKTSESAHRCAAEIMAAMMRGAKHWNFEKTKNLYEKLAPLIKLSLNNITSESDGIWGCAFATAAEGIDPNKQYFLHETLLENPICEMKSFTDCSRLYCLQGAFNQHVWRMGSVAHRLLNYLTPFLNHPFQNVRDRIGSTLINIFENDMNFETLRTSKSSPHLEDFLAAKSQELLLLKNDEDTNHVINPDTEYAASIRLFKTIAQFLTGVINRCTNGNEKIYFEFLPIGVRLEKCEHDKELAEACSVVFALMAQALTQPACMDEAFKKIEELSYSPSWSVRLSIIDIMQVLVFNNMAIVYSCSKWIDKVQAIVLRLLEDNVLEVREKSAQVLGGLIHCSFLPATDKLLELFKKKCKTKVIKRSNITPAACSSTSFDALNDNNSSSIRIRHCGVLGLCAFITAYPYDIPDFVPTLFGIISNHMNDPQPIPTTIRKTLADFKRTHHDGWDFHQLKFTESQLAVLSDLNVPPSYVN